MGSLADLQDKGRIRDQLGERGLVGTGAGQSNSVNLIVLPPFTEELVLEWNGVLWQTSDIGTAFILGHADNGKLGTSTLGAGTKSAFVNIRVINPYNTFHEHFKDTQFKDATNTTATWDVTNSRVDFTNGQIMRTLAFFLDDRDGVNVVPFLTYTGTLVISVCGNGDASFPNFWEVDNEDSTGVSPSANTVRLKLDSTNFPGGRSFTVTRGS